MYRCFLKPLADYTGCLLLLPLALPLLLLGAVLSGISFGFGNMLFVQTRAGYRGSIFRLYKLTTMRPGPQPDAVRLTKTGLFLRRTSLDELPQFINVLCGQMSLVGPRPLLPEYLPLYSATQLRRHNVKPGISGLAQISGRNALTWSRKFAADVVYTRRISFGLDLYILFKTALSLFKTADNAHSGHATMPPFTGNSF